MSMSSTQYENKSIGRRLAAVRAATGLVQEAFAAPLGFSPRAYANYERGEREPPLALLRLMLELHGVDPIWLLTGPGEEPERVTSRRLDEDLLEDLIKAIEEELADQKKTLKPSKKARLVRLGYELYSPKGRVDRAHLRGMLSLAA